MFWHKIWCQKKDFGAHNKSETRGSSRAQGERLAQFVQDTRQKKLVKILKTAGRCQRPGDLERFIFNSKYEENQTRHFCSSKKRNRSKLNVIFIILKQKSKNCLLFFILVPEKKIKWLKDAWLGWSIMLDIKACSHSLCAQICGIPDVCVSNTV